MCESEEEAVALKRKGVELFNAVCYSVMSVENIDEEDSPCPVSGDAMRIMGVK